MRQLFGLVLRCMREGHAELIIKPSEQIAAHYFSAGVHFGTGRGDGDSSDYVEGLNAFAQKRQPIFRGT